MGELLTKLVELVDLVIQGNKASVIKLIIVISLLFLILPKGLDYFYENIRTEQKIRILKELIEIDANNFEDQRLKDYYETILNSINKNDKSSFAIIVTNDRPVSINEYFIPRNILKFISGSFWWLLLFILCFFVKQETVGAKIAAQIIVFIIVLIFGIIGTNIPTFSSLAINLVGFPLIQLIIIVSIAVAVNKTKKNN